MRLIRRFLLLTVLGVAGVAAYMHWSDNGQALKAKAADLAVAAAKREAAEVASGVAEKAGDAKEKLGETISDSRLTAKIKSKMALDDHVNARDINVDTEGSVATLTGVVASADERRRAVQLARDTDGITRVVDHLVVGSR